MGLNDNLRAFWKLDEASGSRADSSGNGRTLTDNNSVGQVAGKVGNAAQFNAANSRYLSAADAAWCSFGNESFTVAGWIYLDSAGAEAAVLGKNTEWRCTVTTGRKPRLVLPSTSLSWSTALSLATWYFVVWQYDAAADLIRISVNNATPETVADSNGATDGTNELRVGRQGTAYFDGRVDALGLWGGALTPAEITQLYNAGAGLEPPFATIYSQTLSESAALSEAVAKSLSRGLADGAALSDLAPRALARTLAEGVLLADASVMALARVFEEALALSDTRGALLSRGLADGAGLGDEIVRTVARTLGDGVTLAEQRLALLVRAFEENLQVEDVVVRTLSRTFLEALATSDSFVALVPKLMAYRVGVGPTSTRLGPSATSARLLKGGGGES